MDTNHKLYKKLYKVIKKDKPKKMKKLSSFFENQNELNITTFEYFVDEVIEQHPEYHDMLKDVFLYCLISDEKDLFQLFYESLVGNYKLYCFLSEKFGYSEDEFYGFLLEKAENCSNKEVSRFALGILLVLGETFLESRNDQKNKK